MFLNIYGVLNSIFSIGKGTDRVHVRSNSGVIQAKNYSGDWQNILGQSGSDTFTDMKEPTGFINTLSSSINFNNTTRTFSIAPKTPTYPSYDVYYKNSKINKSLEETVTISDTSGLWFIYFDSNSDLVASQSAWNFSEVIPIATIYWNSVTGVGLLSEERHSIVMDWATHSYLHRTVGTRFESGFAISGYTLNTDSNSAVTVGLGGGFIHDEDLRHSIVHSNTPNNPFEQILNDACKVPVFYRSGATGLWTKDTATDYVFKNASTGNNLVAYNNFTGGTWQQTECTNSFYTAVWVFATNFISEPVISIQGQRQDNTVSSARTNNTYESLNFGDLPFQEAKVLYRIILQTSTSYNNTRKVRIADVQDLRSISNIPSGTYVATSHSSLSGLTNSDHPASAIFTDVGNFDRLLSNVDNSVQKAIETLDEHNHTPITNISSDYSCTSFDRVLFINTGVSNLNITLPLASTVPNREVCIKKIDSGVGTVTILRDGTDTIDGDSSISFDGQYTHLNIISNGANWFITGGVWN